MLMQQLVIVKNDRDVSVTDVRLGVTLSLLFVHAPRRITLWESQRQSAKLCTDRLPVAFRQGAVWI